MKKLILFLGLLAGVAGVANAQETRFGVKAGVSLASITLRNTTGVNYLVGANGGVMADFSFSDRLSFHPELLFSQKGVKFESPNSYPYQIRTSYLDVPLLLRLKVGGLFFVEAGPQVGFLAARKAEAYGTTSTSTDGTRKVDVGYIAGVGYQLPQGLELGLRYNGGISDLSDPSGSSKSRNSVFQFQVGYLFGGK